MQHLTAASRLSIHAPTRGAKVFPDVLIWRPDFQSTLLQEERLTHFLTVRDHLLLSIHAPTRGATLN